MGRHSYSERNAIAAITMSIVGIIAVSCGNNHDIATVDDRPVISVTIEPLRYFVEGIVGDRYRVVTMVVSGGNPETYEPTARQMRQLAHSSLYIKVGDIGFERTWMARLTADAPVMTVVDTSTGIDLIATEGGAPDPHTWMSVVNARVIVENIFAAVAAQAPSDSAYFAVNKQTLLAHIDSVGAEIEATIATKEQRAFLIYHPILTYFARDYGLSQIPLEEEGREAGVARIKDVIDIAKEQNIKTFFVQREFGATAANTIAESVGATQTEIDPLGYEWDKEIVRIAKQLR